MEINEVLQNIKSKAKQRDEYLKKEQNRKAQYEKALEQKILSLKCRIDAIIKIANTLISEGYVLPDNSVSDHIHRRVGIMGYIKGINYPREKTVCYVGLCNGGYCGSFDLYTDGREIFWKDNSGWGDETIKYDRYQLGHHDGIQDMETFIGHFDEFESNIYDYAKNI